MKAKKLKTNHKDIYRTDEDRHRHDTQDRTKQENASYDVLFFSSQNSRYYEV